jgi:hypothetical protein
VIGVVVSTLVSLLLPWPVALTFSIATTAAILNNEEVVS